MIVRYSFSDLKFKSRPLGGVAARLVFPNGYEASVVCGPNTYGGPAGLFELAIIYNGQIVYDTPVTSDVLGHLTEGDVTERLNEISMLPPRGGAAN